MKKYDTYWIAREMLGFFAYAWRNDKKEFTLGLIFMVIVPIIAIGFAFSLGWVGKLVSFVLAFYYWRMLKLVSIQ